MDVSTPSNRDPQDQIDPANPPPEHEDPAERVDETDQDSEPTLNAPDDARPDGIRTSPPAAPDDGAPA
jgi:hypothetical protein